MGLCCLGPYVILGIGIGFVLFILFIIGVWLTSPVPNKKRLQLQFYDPAIVGETVPFPSLASDASVDLSIVIPAYNEGKRLPPCLDELFPYMSTVDYTYEVIVVDDGSKDDTVDVVHKYSEKYGADIIRCMSLPCNRGKGGAIRQGVLSARGREILFADADGATDIKDLGKVRKALAELCKSKDTEYGIAVGSRAHLQDDATANRSFIRNILMWGFHMFVFVIGGVSNIKDTQCGFKLFTREAARDLFTNMNIERWAFDVELFVIANILSFPAVEVAVNWEEIDGSKLVPIVSWLEMAKDLLMIRMRYLIGAWVVVGKIKIE